jgi:hypothetical protein
VAVQLRDSFGNPTATTGKPRIMHACGPSWFPPSHMTLQTSKHPWFARECRFDGVPYTALTGEGSEVKVVANGPQSVQFINAGYGRHSATLVTAGSYVLTATFGGKLASGALA